MANNITEAPRISARRFILYLLFVIIISAASALVITFHYSWEYLVFNLVVSFSVGLGTFFIGIILYTIFKPTTLRGASIIVLIALCGGILIAWQIGPAMLNWFSVEPSRPDRFLNYMVISVVACIAGTYIFYSLAIIARSKEIINEERLNRMTMERDVLQAELKILQAQIEPHFLFNTLSNLISLVDTDSSRAKSMLLNLTHYLRGSLSRTMSKATTLGQEIEMVEAYLAIQKIRMGDRLKVVIDVPDMIRNSSFSPMLLQPLVENSVKHGIEPQIEGGSIRIRATRSDSVLRVAVEDSGRGFTSLNNAGIGIPNVRERLHLLFGEKGKLVIEENRPSGIKAVIEVPFDD